MQTNVTAQPLLLGKLLTVACCSDCVVVDRRAEEWGGGEGGREGRGEEAGHEKERRGEFRVMLFLVCSDDATDSCARVFG